MMIVLLVLLGFLVVAGISGRGVTDSRDPDYSVRLRTVDRDAARRA